MSKKGFIAVAAYMLLGAGFAAAGIVEEDSVKIRFHGYMGFETEEIVAGRFRNAPRAVVDHRWGGNTVGNLTADATLSERARLL